MICLHKFLLQDPAEADKLLKIQRDLDETKIILVSAEIVQDFTCNAFCRLPITLLLFPCAFAPYFDFLQDKFLSFFQFIYSLACSVLRKKKKIVFVGNKEVMWLGLYDYTIKMNLYLLNLCWILHANFCNTSDWTKNNTSYSLNLKCPFD